VAAFAPAPLNRLGAIAGVLVLVAGIAGGILHIGLFFAPALVVLAVGGIKLTPSSRGRQLMRPDNTAPIIAAARQRHELTRSKVIQALRELDRAGTPVTFQAVAATARCPGPGCTLSPISAPRSNVSAKASAGHRPAHPCRPAHLRLLSSLRARLEAALERNRTLTEQNQRLRRQLEQALGERRSSPSTDAASFLPADSRRGR
jgi:hypothetical protein